MLRFIMNNWLVGVILFAFSFSMEAQMNTVNLKSKKDSYINNKYASTNYGTDSTMSVGTHLDTLTSYTYNRGYLAFDLSSIPSNAVIYSATLTLHVSDSIGDSPRWYVRRVLSSWTEAGITASGQPSISEFDQDNSRSLEQYGTEYQYDLTWMTQRIVGGALTNNGWMIQVQNEAYSANSTREFYTNEASDSNLHPELEILYYFPHELANVVITHESDTLAVDGSIDLDILYGTQDFDWEWENAAGSIISTDTILNSVAAGWYGLHLQGSTYTDEHFYYSFLVGTNGRMFELDYRLTSPNYMDISRTKDLIESGVDYTDQNFPDYQTIVCSRWRDNVVMYTEKTYLRLRLWIDEALTFDRADIYFLGGYHYQSGGLNESELQLIREDWNERVLCADYVPNIDDTISEYLPPTIIDGVQDFYLNRNFDFTNFFNYWKQDNNKNFGVVMQNTNDDNYLQRQLYWSSYNAEYLHRDPFLKFEFGAFPDPPTFSMNDTLDVANVQVDISEIASEYTAPFFYQISLDETPNLDSLFAIYSDTIWFPEVNDTLLYSQSTSATSFSFNTMSPNLYTVSVRDSLGNLVLDQHVLIQDTLEFDDNTGLKQIGLNEIRASQVNAVGSFGYYITEGKYSQFSIELESSSEEQFYGYAEMDSVVDDVSDIYYGFYIDNDSIYPISAGTVGSALALIPTSSKVEILNDNDSLMLRLGGTTIHSYNAPTSYQFKLGIMTQPNAPAHLIQTGMIPIKLKAYTFKWKTPEIFTCEGDLGYFNFLVKKRKLDPGCSVTYSVQDWNGNTIISNATTSSNTTTSVMIDDNSDPIEAGVYTVFGTLNCSPSISFSETVFVGYEARWTQYQDYNITGVTEERDAYTDLYASARGSNVLKFNQKGVVEFGVGIPSSNNGFKHFLRFYTDYPNAIPNDPEMILSDFIAVLTVAGQDYLQVYKAGMGFTQPGFPLAPSDRIKIELTTVSGGVPDLVKIYINNQLKESISRTSSNGFVRINTRVLGDYFENIVTSFGCPKTEDQFAHLDYKMDGYYHIFRDGLIRFQFKQEYDTEDLSFTIYNMYDEPIKTDADFSAIETTNGMNHLTIDVSETADCIGRGFFYLEVINSKKEKMYLRFYNNLDMSGTCPNYD